MGPAKPALIPTLQVVEGPCVGKLFRFRAGEVNLLTVGRTDESQIALDHPTVSRFHARFTWMRLGADFLMLMEDLQSTNGSTVNGEKATSAYLKEGDLIGLGEVLMRFQMLSPLELVERDRLIAKATLADVDPLTGLGTRNYLEEQVQKLCAECEARGLSLSLLMLDLDHFKRINDALGHPIGDRVLQAAGQVVRENVRDTDVAIRFGGEEILVLLPGSPMKEAIAVAERLRAAVQAFDTSSFAASLSVTVSVGVAQRLPAEPFQQLLERGDRALYRAKAGGRNRVEIELAPATGDGP
jgi:diguanylate cyclase (GGDEF)-like protein